MRRSIAAARSYSISCSQIAQASASKGSGRRRAPQPRAPAQRAPDQRIAGEAAQERPQVLVDAEREAHPLDAVRGGRPASPRARRTGPCRGAGWATLHDHRQLAVVQQALEHAAAAAQHAVAPGPARQAKRAGRRDLHAQLDQVAQRSRLSDRRRRRAGARPTAASGCPRSGRARRPCPLPPPSAPRWAADPASTRAGPWRAPTERALAAVHQPDDRGSRDEPAGGHRGGLHGRQHRRAAAAPLARERARRGPRPHERAVAGEHGKRVDLLGLARARAGERPAAASGCDGLAHPAKCRGRPRPASTARARRRGSGDDLARPSPSIARFIGGSSRGSSPSRRPSAACARRRRSASA